VERGTVADDRRAREGPAAWISAVVGVLALVVAVVFGVLTLEDDEDGGDPPAPAPTTIALPTPTPTPAPTSDPPPAEESAGPAPEPTTRSPEPASGWPVDADDGSPAMYAYFGSEFTFPDWVACEATYCIVGSRDDVHLYRQKPIRRLATLVLGAADPAAALVTAGLSPAQATALLAR
jgi:hypothetical protein